MAMHSGRLTIERRGGLAGLKARGEVDVATLAAADRSALEALFSHPGRLPPAPGADRFTYRITRESAAGPQTLDVPEHLLPRCLADAVHDELA
ncbi:MAG: hypothetical protein QM718_07875 [Steroidobacteraceae bacterium]